MTWSKGWPARALTLLAGLAAGLGHPPFGFIFGLLGYALLLALIDAEGPRPLRQAFFRGWLAGVGYFSVSVWWITEPFMVDAKEQGWMAPFALVLMAGGLALFWGLASLLYRALKVPGPARVLVFAGCLSGFEWLRGHVFSGFPWDLPGETWEAGTAPSQAASLIGAYGLTWLTVAIAAAPGVAELAWCFGFPYADFVDCGPAVAAFAETQAEADAAADELVARIAAREADFVQDTLPSAEAVAEALRARAGAGGPIVLADTQDNPGGGGHGDTTELLAELVRQGAKGALVCLINDSESAAACHAAGIGAMVALSLGGKSDGMPFACDARVVRLTDGVFTLTGPMGAGTPGQLGPTALIDIEGVRVIVATRKMQALDQAIIRHVGIEPSSCPILALKSSVHFRADFGPMAGKIIVAIAPGPVVADPAILNFRHVRADIRRRPRLG